MTKSNSIFEYKPTSAVRMIQGRQTDFERDIKTTDLTRVQLVNEYNHNIFK